MSWVDQIKSALPEYAKDTKLNLDAVINRSSLDREEAEACALAAAAATGNGKIVGLLLGHMQTAGVDGLGGELGVEATAAMTAASLMAMTNVYYPYQEMAADDALTGLPPQLRMNAIATHGGTTKLRFEAYSLAASIVGKCHFCVKAHYDTLRKEGYSLDQLRDIGRIAAVMNSVCKVLVG
jgi:alkyl hydroperoxide reductase subunit D